MRLGFLIFTCCLALVFSAPVSLAQVQAEDTAPEAEISTDKGDREARLSLADEMLKLNPPRDQVRAAIEGYVKLKLSIAPEATKEKFRSAMSAILNYKALEEISREAYADIFTREELEAMVEYYSKPAAKSAGEKMGELNGRIAPEIVKMLDQALMRARTSPKR